MSDLDLQKFGGQVGVGVKKPRKHAYDQAIKEGKGHIVGLKDIPNQALEIGTVIGEGKQATEKDAVYDLPLSIAIARGQVPDLNAFPFDFMSLNQNVAAGAAGFAALTITISNGIRAKIERFGWYTNGAGAANISFGLYVGEELMLPGGKFIGDQPRPTTQFDPSGGSIAFEDLSMAPIPVSPSTDITIRVTNADAVNAYPVWCRIYGWHWEEVEREDGRRAYYNKKHDKIM